MLLTHSAVSPCCAAPAQATLLIPSWPSQMPFCRENSIPAFLFVLCGSYTASGHCKKRDYISCPWLKSRISFATCVSRCITWGSFHSQKLRCERKTETHVQGQRQAAEFQHAPRVLEELFLTIISHLWHCIKAFRLAKHSQIKHHTVQMRDG